MQLSVGLVGARRSVSTVAGFGACPEATVVAVCDVDAAAAEAAARQHGISRWYTDYQQMLDAGVDAVVIATPMQFHARQAIEALNRGVHVLCEVTAAVSLEECAQLAAAAQASTATYMMAENYCYLKPNVLVASMIRAGLFGNIYFGEGEYTHELEQLHFTPDGRPTWRFTWQVGRRGCTYPTHSLGPLLQWFDDRVVSVSCHGSGSWTPPARRMDDVTIMACRLAKGGLVMIRNDMISKRPHLMTYYTVQGTQGCYEASRGYDATAKVWLADHCDGPDHWRPLGDFEEQYLPASYREVLAEAQRTGHGGGDYFVVRDFVSAVVNKATPPIDVYRALDYTAPGLVSEESIERGGEPRAVPDFRPAR